MFVFAASLLVLLFCCRSMSGWGWLGGWVGWTDGRTGGGGPVQIAYLHRNLSSPTANYAPFKAWQSQGSRGTQGGQVGQGGQRDQRDHGFGVIGAKPRRWLKLPLELVDLLEVSG